MNFAICGLAVPACRLAHAGYARSRPSRCSCWSAPCSWRSPTWRRRRSIRRSRLHSSTRPSTAATCSSGHTGLPFLAALAFWHIPQWRTFYLALTAFFGTIVLLGHYHYSIDVLAALFITHGVFQVSCWLFARDYALFRATENPAVPRQKRSNRKPRIPAGRPARTLEPFTLHVVSKDDPAPGDQQRTGVVKDPKS
jgi:hypothetical protein